MKSLSRTIGSVSVSAFGVLVLAQLFAPNSAFAQSVTGEERTLVTKDGWPLKINYYQSEMGSDAPVVVLLHSKSSSQLSWGAKSATGGFVRRLVDLKFAVIALDFRKHGLSKPMTDEEGEGTKKPKPTNSRITKVDYQAMIGLDLEAVKKFIFEEHQAKRLNMRRTAIIAPEMAATMAILYTLIDWQKKPHDDAPTAALRTPRGQDIQAVVAISPGTIPGISPNRAYSYLKSQQIAFLVCVGKKDKLDRRQASSMYAKLGGTNKNKPGMFFQEYDVNLRGTDLLGKKIRIEEHILGFLNEAIKKPDIPWRDRRSKLSR
ncbi:MAG: hypothetical protein CMJ78_14150 [Planctomycetaceae bacterium]|nr:hypothetical protein [Planctomycetaceae bacterium]